MALDRTNKLDPLNNKTHITNPDGTPTAEFMRQWNAQRSTNSGTAAEIAEAIAEAEAAYALALAVASVQIGGDNVDIEPAPAAISDGSITLSLKATAVTPGSYTNTDLTVDENGRITAASNGSGGSGGGSTMPLTNGAVPNEAVDDGEGQMIGIPLAAGVETKIGAYTKAGIIADRPVSPIAAAGTIIMYYATDINVVYIWVAPTWHALSI